MEDGARHASAWAQQLKSHCDRLCSQSQEETERMNFEIRRHLELRIKDDEFWVSELQQRTIDVRGLNDDLGMLDRRLAKAGDICRHLLNINHECVQLRQDVFHGKDLVSELLTEEEQTLEKGIGVINSVMESTAHGKNNLENVSMRLDACIKNKLLALNADHRSLNLKYYDRLESLETERALMESTDVDTADGIARLADTQVLLCKQHCATICDLMETMCTSISSQVTTVSKAVQQHVADMQKEKEDLQQHLNMIDAHKGTTEQTMSSLMKAMVNKEEAIQLIRNRIRLHFARPSTEQSTNDEVLLVLQQECVEAEADLAHMMEQLPVLEANLRSFRRTRLDLGLTIASKMEHIEVEQLRCLGIRIGMLPIAL